MIEQQLYTRSSKGYFLHSPGFDTVRFSSGLAEDFVQKNNYLFTYNGKDVRDVNAMITIITRAVLNNSTVALIGSNPYKYMSYDGLKDVFISHAYYIPDADNEEQVRDVRKIAGVTEFIRQHNDGSNEPLPRLSAIPFENRFSEIDIVNAVNTRVAPEFISKLVYAALVSAYSNKKVYLVPQDITDVYFVLHVLKSIYFFLPYAVRKKIGYCTMINNQIIPEGVNIAFVPQSYLRDVKNGRIFNSNISNDFCFDFSNQCVINDGGIDFSDKVAYIKLVNIINTGRYINQVPKIFDSIDRMTKGRSTDLKLISDIAELFITALEAGKAAEDMSVELISGYERLYNRIDNDEAFSIVDNYISNYKEKTEAFGNKLIKKLVECFSSVSSRYQDIILESYIIPSIRASVASKDDFFTKLAIVSANRDIEGIVLSTFIIVDDSAISLFFEKEFERDNSLAEVCSRVRRYENDEILRAERLTENVCFVMLYGNRVSALLKKDSELSKLKSFLEEGTRFDSERINDVTGSTVSSYIENLTRRYKPADFSIKELELLVYDFKNYTDENFINEAKFILQYFGYHTSFDELFYLMRRVNPELKIYLRNYFKVNKVGRETFFAYTASYVNIGRVLSIDIDSAFCNIGDSKMLLSYAIWMMKKFDFTNPYCNELVSHITGRNDRAQKYADLANAICKALAHSDEEISSSDAKELTANLVRTMEYVNEADIAPLTKEFSKNLKKAITGKGFIGIAPVAGKHHDEKGDKKFRFDFGKSKKDYKK